MLSASRTAPVLVSLLFAAVFVWTSCRAIVTAPFSDMILWLGAYFDARDSGNVLGNLLQFHNEHRLALVRLLTIVDVTFGDGREWSYLFASWISQAVILALLGREMAAALPGRAAIHPLAWLMVPIVLTAANAHDMAIPINCVYPMCVACCLGSLVAFEAAERGTWAWRLLALALAMLAGLANAVAFAVWPALAWLAWRGRAGMAWLDAITLVGVAYIAAYVQGLATGASLHDLTDIGRVARYGCAYLGLPLSAFHWRAGLAAGLCLAAAAGCALIWLSRRGVARSRGQNLAGALILFSLGTAAMAVLGRVAADADGHITIRYSLLLTPMHAGLALLVVPWLARYAEARGVPQRLELAVAAAMLAALAFDIRDARQVVHDSRVWRKLIARYEAGERSPAVADLVFFDLPLADAVLARLKREPARP